MELLRTLCLLTVAISHGSCSSHPKNDHTPHYGADLLKRWYGIKEKPGDPNKDQIPHSHPWPVTCSNPVIQPVRYCFPNERSAVNLGPIVEEAIKIWAPAMQNSALRIELDPRAGGDPKFRCPYMEGEKDMLVIFDNTKDDLPVGQQTCATHTTTGYYYTMGDYNKDPYRHAMYFCLQDPNDKAGTRRDAIRGMAHELGHAIGFSHEHQRPDRDVYLKFYCKNVAGYNRAVERAIRDKKGLYKNPYHPSEAGYSGFQEMTDEQRKRDICSDWTASQSYFPAMKTWLRTDQFRYSASPERLFFDTTEVSTQFDYESIMIYDFDAELGAGASSNTMIIAKRSDNTPVYMGGSKTLQSNDPTAKIFGVSKGDIARVAQLYPNHTPEGDEAKKTGEWGASGGMKVTIREGVEVEMRPRGWNVTKRGEL